MDWIHDAKLPRYDDIHEFEVWIYGDARKVRRAGNNSMSLTPGTLIFTDCTHPMQNVLCHEPDVMAWRMTPNVGGNRLAPTGATNDE